MPKQKRKSDKQKQKDTRNRIRQYRENNDYKSLENTKRRKRHEIERESAETRERENAEQARRMADAREDPAFLEQDNLRRKIAHRTERENPNFRQEENVAQAKRMADARQDPGFLEQDNLRRKIAHRTERENPNFKQEENVVKAKRMADARQDPGFLEQDNLRRRKSHVSQRKDPKVREMENTRRSECRTNEEYRTPERLKDSKRRAKSRLDPVRRKIDFQAAVESTKKRRHSMHESYEKSLHSFYVTISEGPIHTCSCCGGLFYKKSIRPASREKLEQWGCTEEVIHTVLFVEQQPHRFCNTCHENIRRRKKVPRVCLSNGLDFPVIPQQLLTLNRLEERLVSLRLPFMQIRLKGYEKQWAIKGNVVNVENNVDMCVKCLPRRFDQAGVVQVALMRKMSYRNPYIHDNISPSKVLRATRLLLDSPLYKKYNVVMSEDWNTFETDDVDFIVDSTNDSDPAISSDTLNDDESNYVGNSDEEGHPSSQETLVFIEDDFSSYGLKLAPGEGRTPIPLCMDTEAERLSFPTVYCGQPQPSFLQGLKLTYTDIAKSELRRYDRRAAKPEKVLFSFRKSFNEKVRHAYSICLRQTKKGTSQSSLRASDCLKADGLSNILAKDDGYSVYKNVRSSPAFWKEQQKRVVSTVRQLGACTFFITLSAAEAKWNELLVILMKVLRNTNITAEDAEGLPYTEKANLISSDPVTCMRHFDHKYKALLQELFKKPRGVFEPYCIGDFYSRVEFQMRGSPHSHGLYWIENSPAYDPECAESTIRCVEFIDQYITCKRDDEGDMEKLIGYQIHNHSDTCKKGNKKISCRFHFPRPPMPTTVILKPLPKCTTDDEKKSLKEAHKKINTQLQEFGRTFKENIQFPEFLKMIDMEEDIYYSAIRSSIEKDTVFLKRRTCDIFVNNYNRRLLTAWKANMDIQFVLDAYACAKYCASYIVKSDPGVSKLLKAVIRDSRNGNSSATGCLKQFAKILMTRTEISAQEAVAYLLGLPCTFSSRNSIYINTAEPEKRVRILKSKEDLEKLPEDSSDVCEKGLLDHYVQRPDALQNICLADFASLYEYKKSSSRKNACHPNEDEEEDVEEAFDEEREIQGICHTYELKDNSGYVTKRRVRKIIRFRHFNKSNQTQYFREQLMLFLPWNDEERDLLKVDPISTYEESKDTILKNAKPYYHNIDLDEGVLGAYIHELEAVEEENCQPERILNEMELQEDEHFAGAELDGTRTMPPASEKFLLPKLLKVDDFEVHMQSLNTKQRRITYHILHKLKCSKDPFYIYISGGAGVGKSHVITAVVQGFLRYCNKSKDFDPNGLPMLVCAPTGKAAFNVFGMTLHSAFHLPCNQASKQMGKLEEGLANTLRLKFKDLKIIIIDEISMVSFKQLMLIDQRLRQIFNSSLQFGGISVLAVGHLRQLPPIPGGSSSFVFKSSLPPLRNDLWEMFQFFELDEIMRQKGELEFCKALNNMSEGQMDRDDILLLQSRKITESLCPPEDAIWLFKTNAECEAYNDALHSKMTTERAISEAFDEVVGDASRIQREKLLNDAKSWTRIESDGLPYECKLQVGGLYFVTTNIDVPDGLFNGATGTLKKIDYGRTISGVIIPKIAWIEFTNPLIGSKARDRLLSNPNDEEGSHVWTPIPRIKRALSKSYKCAGMTVYRENIPLVACNGMTIAKSQGSSMKTVVVCTKKTLQREALYVACSRATSKNGLFIDGDFKPPRHPGEDDDVSKEIAVLRENQVKFEILSFFYSTHRYRLYFQNIRSFMKYRKDICSDTNIMESTHLFFVEPHILPSHFVDIPTFHCVARENCQMVNNTTNSIGFLSFSKDPNTTLVEKVAKQDGRKHYVIAVFQVADSTVIICYKHPSFSAGVFLQDLSNVLQVLSAHDLVLIGDLNMNIMEDNNKLVKFFEKFNMLNKLGDIQTTEIGSQIDVCFARKENMKASVYETYISDHNGICVSW